MVPQQIITLTTDFGIADSYVAQMKGVIATLSPGVTIVDVTHSVAPFDVGHAAQIVSEAAGFFPEGTIHLAVVDPGVGSERRRVIVEGWLPSDIAPRPRKFTFVGPDNGIFRLVLRQAEQLAAWEISALDRLPAFSSGITFYGRNVFAPVAAMLSQGNQPRFFGAPIAPDSLRPLDHGLSEPVLIDGIIRGEIRRFDHFGNAATNIRATLLQPGVSRLHLPKISKTLELSRSFSSFGAGEPGAIINSQGFLEIVANRASAREVLCLALGDLVHVSVR